MPTSCQTGLGVPRVDDGDVAAIEVAGIPRRNRGAVRLRNTGNQYALERAPAFPSGQERQVEPRFEDGDAR